MQAWNGQCCLFSARCLRRMMKFLLMKSHMKYHMIHTRWWLFTNILHSYNEYRLQLIAIISFYFWQLFFTTSLLLCMKAESVISTEIYGADLHRTLGEILAYCQVMMRQLILPVIVNLELSIFALKLSLRFTVRFLCSGYIWSHSETRWEVWDAPGESSKHPDQSSEYSCPLSGKNNTTHILQYE